MAAYPGCPAILRPTLGAHQFAFAPNGGCAAARGVISLDRLIILRTASGIKGLGLHVKYADLDTLRHFHSFAIMKLSEPPASRYWEAFASSGLTTTSAWPLFCIRSRRGPTLQTVVHCLAADHHHCRGFLIGLGYVGLRGAAQICLPGGDGGDHNHGANAKDPGHQLKVTSHEISHRVAGGKSVEATRRCREAVLCR